MPEVTPFEQAARSLIASRLAPGTRKLYATDLAVWLAHCELGAIDPANCALEVSAAFRDGQLARSSPLTVRRRLAALSAMYRSALAARTASCNPFDPKALPWPPADTYAVTEAVSQIVAQRIIAAAKADMTVLGTRDTAVLLLLYETGMRRQEVAALERDRVLVRDGKLVVWFYGKRRKRREAELPADATKALSAWLSEVSASSPSRFVFPQRDERRPIDPSTINRIVTKRMKEAGVRDVHPHQFRAAFATKALDKMPLNEVQAALGHENPKTTQLYDRGKRGAGVTEAVAKSRSEQE